MLQEGEGCSLKSESSGDLSLEFDDISAIGLGGGERQLTGGMSKNHGAVDLNGLIFPSGSFLSSFAHNDMLPGSVNGTN